MTVALTTRGWRRRQPAAPRGAVLASERSSATPFSVEALIGERPRVAGGATDEQLGEAARTLEGHVRRMKDAIDASTVKETPGSVAPPGSHLNPLR